MKLNYNAESVYEMYKFKGRKRQLLREKKRDGGETEKLQLRCCWIA